MAENQEITKNNQVTKLDAKTSIFNLSKVLNLNNDNSSTKILINVNNKDLIEKINANDNYGQLTVQMFFDFMRTAYQVSDNVEELSNILAINSEIDWTNLTKIGFCLQNKKDKICFANDTNSSQSKNDDKEDENKVDDVENSKEIVTYNLKNVQNEINIKFEPLSIIMKKKLSDILHEGILDSVLTYMLPKTCYSHPAIKKSILPNDIKKPGHSLTALDKLSSPFQVNRDKDKSPGKNQRKSVETEVEIHVCDETKNIKKDFRCPQKLLIQKMCYFADVTAGQKLEEMDISVHCDIVIFDWLMRWVKKDIIKKSEWPVLDANNVIPITVSASFLQMEPLLDQCLVFCHENMADVLKTSTIFTCLNDTIFTRLANLFSNVDLENLKDKRDKIQSRLFCKLIIALADPIPDNKRGHYSSLATLFKCHKCEKYLINSISDGVPCVASSMKIDSKGNISSKHSRDLSWTLNDYIVNLRSELRSWRRVYWRLWGDCHFFNCRKCNTYFPINQMDWCRFHSETPQFFANEQQRPISFPLGRYPCCSQRAYRFELIPNLEGCRFKEHIPVVSGDNDGHILNVFALYRDVISQEPKQMIFPEKITRLVARDPTIHSGKLPCKETMWWDGIELIPPRAKLGLLGKIWGGSGIRKASQLSESYGRKLHRQSSHISERVSRTSSTSESDENDDVATGYIGSSIDDDSDNMSDESRDCSLSKATNKSKRDHHNKKNENTRLWNINLTMRYNQDNQRDFEEKAAIQMIAYLTKRTLTDSNCYFKLHKYNQTWNNAPLGGIYVKLESEFREKSAQLFKLKNGNQTQIKGLARIRSSKI